MAVDVVSPFANPIQPPTGPLKNFAKILWKTLESQINPGLLYVLEYVSDMVGGEHPTPSSWVHVQCVFHDNTSTDTADVMITTFDIANITDGKIDSTWTNADFTTVDGQLKALCDAWVNRAQQRCVHVERRYYVRTFGPIGTDPATNKPLPTFLKSGAPVLVVPDSTVGIGTGVMPNQISATTTDRTPYPRHWGRNYWPLPAQSSVTSSGYIAPASVDSWLQWMDQTYVALMNAQFFPVVPVGWVNKTQFRGLLGVSSVQMDDVYDVVRRRRAHTVSYKAQIPLP